MLLEIGQGRHVFLNQMIIEQKIIPEAPPKFFAGFIVNVNMAQGSLIQGHSPFKICIELVLLEKQMDF